jgi:hypothetical protein
MSFGSSENKLINNVRDSIGFHAYRSLTQEDITKLDTWQEDIKSIQAHFPIGISYRMKDKSGQDWVQIGGTGWVKFWAVKFKN